jgi:hypothetical protein
MMPVQSLPNGVYDLIVVGLLFPGAVYGAALFSPSAKLVGLFKFAGLTSYAVYVLHVPLSVASNVALKFLFGLNVAEHRPLSGFVFVGLLLVFCWIIDLAYDVPLRRHLSSFSPSTFRRLWRPQRRMADLRDALSWPIAFCLWRMTWVPGLLRN